MKRAFGTTVLAIAIGSAPATAHHSNPLYFDMSKAVTLEGEVLRVEWINPHVLLFLESKNDKGQPETWIAQSAVPERRADGPADPTRRRQNIRAHRRSGRDQAFEW